MGAYLRQQSSNADVTVFGVIAPVAPEEIPVALVGLIDPELVEAGGPLRERDLSFPEHATRSVSTRGRQTRKEHLPRAYVPDLDTFVWHDVNGLLCVHVAQEVFELVAHGLAGVLCSPSSESHQHITINGHVLSCINDNQLQSISIQCHE
jgi:hypothetical protein